MEDKIVVYSRTNCSQCRATKMLLNSNEVEFEEINLDEQPEAATKLKEMGMQSLPVVVIPGQEPFFGFRPDILEELF